MSIQCVSITQRRRGRRGAQSIIHKSSAVLSVLCASALKWQIASNPDSYLSDAQEICEVDITKILLKVRVLDIASCFDICQQVEYFIASKCHEQAVGHGR